MDTESIDLTAQALGKLKLLVFERDRQIVTLRRELSAVLAAVEHACTLIELGDRRLLAADGPCGNQPPQLSLGEWRQLYHTLNRVRR